ncbi:MAG: CHAP domain-containing protein [Fibrobacter sp.]|nr:CHAP domain-containing protein [Fibrobacter sp.]
MELVNFVYTYLKLKVDYDHAYGAQCVDLFRQYCVDVLEIPEHTGAVEGAKDLWRNYQNLPIEKKYFIRVGPPTKAEPGYVAIWDKSPTNEYGHVAIVLADMGTQLLVIEQNGFTQKGVELKYRDKNYLLGYLERR